MRVWATDFSRVAWEGIRTREEAERFLAERGNDASIYRDGFPLVLKRLSDANEDRTLIKQVLSELHTR